jgi:hypothetical protein
LPDNQISADVWFGLHDDAALNCQCSVPSGNRNLNCGGQTNYLTFPEWNGYRACP